LGDGNTAATAAASEGDPFNDFYDDLSELGDDADENAANSERTADEQMDYLESLAPCPCFAKCCIDSVVTLFCVTLLG
jgi:hypothetical protein